MIVLVKDEDWPSIYSVIWRLGSVEESLLAPPKTKTDILQESNALLQISRENSNFQLAKVQTQRIVPR